MTIEDEARAAGIAPQIGTLLDRHAEALNGGRIEDAEEQSNQIMAILLEEFQANPSPDVLRSLLADRAENDGQWEVAQRIHEQELREAIQLADATPRACSKSRAKFNLARLQWWQGDRQAAYELAKDAVNDVRKIDDWPFQLAWALESFAGFALHAGRIDEALQAADEGLSLLGDSRTTDHFRAMLLLRRAEALLAAGEMAAVRQALDLAWQRPEPYSAMSEAGGILCTFAMWWRTEARLRSRRGDWAGACEAWDSSVAFYRHAASLWENADRSVNTSLADALAEFADVADAAGDRQRADSLREESREVRARNPVTV